MNSNLKATLRGIIAVTFLSGIGCATQRAIEVESPRALVSVSGASYAQPIHHDAPPSEQGVTFVAPADQSDEGFSVKDVAPDELPQPVKKNAHGF